MSDDFDTPTLVPPEDAPARPGPARRAAAERTPADRDRRLRAGDPGLERRAADDHRARHRLDGGARRDRARVGPDGLRSRPALDLLLRGVHASGMEAACA